MAEKKKTSIEDAIAAGPTGGQYTTEQPIGVPSGYTIPGAPKPTFMEGDDWKPARQSPEQIARVQQQLVNSGLLTGSYRIGLWDDATRSAYRNVLEWANAAGEPDDAKALDYLVETRATYGEPPTERAPLLAQVSNPLDVRRNVEGRIIESLGSKRDGLTEEITAGYRQQELAAQQSAYGMQATGGVVTDAPSLEAFAEDKIRRSDPTGFDAHEALTGFDMLAQLMGGG